MLVNTLRITLIGLLGVACTVTGLAAPVPAERAKAEQELAGLAAKLHGTWQGDAGCQGRITFRPDGTYEWRGRGPCGEIDNGTWGMRWSELSPTLILKCKTSVNPARAGTTVEGKLVQLDDAAIAFAESAAAEPLRFSRKK
jgi:hypothetical protein